MGNFKELLIDFEKQLREANAPILEKLKDELTPDRAKELLSHTGINNKSLFDLYSWKNGIKNMEEYSIGELELFPMGIMLSLEDAILHYEIYTKKERIWKESLFPLFTRGGDYLILDINADSKTAGMILLYSPELLLSDKPETMYDSLEDLFKTILDCFKKGAYRINQDDGTIDVNYDLEQKISTERNPKSEYWKR